MRFALRPPMWASVGPDRRIAVQRRWESRLARCVRDYYSTDAHKDGHLCNEIPIVEPASNKGPVFVPPVRAAMRPWETSRMRTAHRAGARKKVRV